MEVHMEVHMEGPYGCHMEVHMEVHMDAITFMLKKKLCTPKITPQMDLDRFGRVKQAGKFPKK